MIAVVLIKQDANMITLFKEIIERYVLKKAEK